MATSSIGRMLDDYKNVRTVPASVSLAFVLLSLYQFGGIEGLTLSWVDFTIKSVHVLPGSTGALLLAFASSETRSLEHYEGVELGAIVAMLAVMYGHQFTPPAFWSSTVPVIGQAIADALLGIGEPLAGMIGFAIVMVGWAVLVN